MKTTTQSNIKYTILVLGKLWMPQCNAAQEIKIKAGKGPFETDIDPSDEMSDLESYICTHTGDFSSVTDTEITKHWTTEDTYASDQARAIRHHSETIKPWQNEDNECAFLDALYPSDDND